MADFKTHVSVGAATGFAVAIVSYNWNLIPNAYMAVIVFFATVIGSFLPDMDSDSGLPLKIIFTVYAYFMAAITLYWMHMAGANLPLKIFVPAASWFFVIKYLRELFRKNTTHRGIFHSTPVWIAVFLISLFVASTTRLSLREQFVIAFAVSTGYFCHLALDELWSFNVISEGMFGEKKYTFDQLIHKKFGRKKSSGTALDLGFNQKERIPGILAWITVAVFLVLDWQTIMSLIAIIGEYH
ncbi:MAG: metal-dependent hydrolase [Bacteroidales bacterium]|nr:metal-dependent hydrolase [Bacteroidales bacterium]MBR3712439.1 metal-dependent hydrolase [Bacteroidales bacterium]